MSGIDIPSLVSAIRKAGDMTQEQLAQRLGVTFGTINGWENGKHAPLRAFRNLLIQLARELGVDSLASGDSETGPSRPSKRRAGVRRGGAHLRYRIPRQPCPYVQRNHSRGRSRAPSGATFSTESVPFPKR
jgi:transcriptional regulator with XRE-family HTH domain